MSNCIQYINKRDLSSPASEIARVLELSGMDLDYTSLQESLEGLNKLAAQITEMPISCVNILDSHNLWAVSNFGYQNGFMPREEAICNYTIQDNDHLEIPELKRDDRFNMNEYVISEPYLNYYCGVPLTTGKGHNIGTLCVADTKPRKLSTEKIGHLKTVAQSIVNRLQSISEIQALAQKLQRISKRPGTLLSTIRGPIAGMVHISDIIKDMAAGKMSDEIVKLANSIKNESSSMLDQANKSLTVHKINTPDNTQPESHHLSLALLQDKLTSLFVQQMAARGIRFDLNISGKNNLPFPKKRILQIAVNLLSNAMRFTPEGGSVSVELTLKEMKSYMTHSHLLYISVQDTGIGIGSEEAEEIEAKNTQAAGDVFKNSDINGYGLNFHLVKDLVQTQGGELRVWSAHGKGTHVEVFIPMDL